MTCEECRGAMPEYWEGLLNGTEHAVVEKHLASCVSCKREANRLGGIWYGLAQVQPEEPASGLRSQFYERLEAYSRGIAEASFDRRTPQVLEAVKHWWSARLLHRLAVALAALVLGFAVATAVNYRNDDSQISQLQSEVSKMRQLLALSLLQQQNASDRLRGVNWAYRIEQPDTEVLAALLYTLNHDQNVNVRLAAVDAVGTFAQHPMARQWMVQAIARQTSPLVQIALIEQLADTRDRAATPPLQDLVKNPATYPEVRERANWALERLK